MRGITTKLTLSLMLIVSIVLVGFGLPGLQEQRDPAER